jgi:UDP-glucuronate decarboxylase
MLNGMQLLITGGTGFFGRALLRSKLANHPIWRYVNDVTVLSRHPDQFLQKYPEFIGLDWLKFHQGDVLKPKSLPSESYTHIIHAAADSTFGPSLTSLARYDQIVSGTRNLLDFAVKKKVQKFLLTSSGAVYGTLTEKVGYVTEDYHSMPDPLNADNAYGIAKREAEHLCALYHAHHGLNYVVARCFAFVGRDLPLNVHFAIGNFIYDALYHDAVTVQGDGTAVRSYLSQEDLAIWLMTMLLHHNDSCAYNLGSDIGITMNHLAHKVRDLLAPNKGVEILGSPTNAARNYYLPSIEKAKQALGLQVMTSLDDAILATAQHHQLTT